MGSGHLTFSNLDKSGKQGNLSPFIKRSNLNKLKLYVNDEHPLIALFPISVTEEEIDFCFNKSKTLIALILLKIEGNCTPSSWWCFWGQRNAAKCPFKCRFGGVLKLATPVKLTLDRNADMMMQGQRNPLYSRYKVAFDNEGLIHAIQIEYFFDCG